MGVFRKKLLCKVLDLFENNFRIRISYVLNNMYQHPLLDLKYRLAERRISGLKVNSKTSSVFKMVSTVSFLNLAGSSSLEKQ